MKNIDKLKSFNSDEMAKFLTYGKSCGSWCIYYNKRACQSWNCIDGIKYWLEQEEKVELLTKYDKKLLTRVALEIKNVRYITFSKENETYNRAVFITKNGFSFGYNFLNLYFKNLEFDKKYTLAELGLEVEE